MTTPTDDATGVELPEDPPPSTAVTVTVDVTEVRAVTDDASLVIVVAAEVGSATVQPATDPVADGDVVLDASVVAEALAVDGHAQRAAQWLCTRAADVIAARRPAGW